MCKKFISLLLSLTILLGAVWVPAGASAGATPQTVTFHFRDKSSNFSKDLDATAGSLYLTLFEKAGTPALTGYDFIGWYKLGDTSQTVITDNTKIDGTDAEVILNAKWEPRTYSVTTLAIAAAQVP